MLVNYQRWYKSVRLLPSAVQAWGVSLLIQLNTALTTGLVRSTGATLGVGDPQERSIWGAQLRQPGLCAVNN